MISEGEKQSQNGFVQLHLQRMSEGQPLSIEANTVFHVESRPSSTRSSSTEHSQEVTSRGLSAGSRDVARSLDSADKPRNVGSVGRPEQLPQEQNSVKAFVKELQKLNGRPLIAINETLALIQNCSTKETVVDYIKSLPEEEKIKLIKESFNKESGLYHFFSIKRGILSTAEHRGSFKALAEELPNDVGKGLQQLSWFKRNSKKYRDTVDSVKEEPHDKQQDPSENTGQKPR